MVSDGSRATKSVVVTVLAVLFAVESSAAELNGLVSDVQDGDSLSLVKATGSYRIRLLDIDAPELGQPFGKEARTSLRELCLFKHATIDTQGEDRFGRTLGRVSCDGVDTSAEQVSRGMAWVYDRYVTDRSLYHTQEEARAARRGLWADPRPVPPWAWRRIRSGPM